MTRRLTNILKPALLTACLALPVAAQEASVVTRINPDTMSPSLQYGYSHVATVSEGAKLVFVAGQVGHTPDGPNDFQSQVDRSFDNLLAGLVAAGATPQDVVRITLLIEDHDPSKLAYLVKKRRAFFGDTAPSSVLIPVVRLYADDVAFEISAIAAVASDKTDFAGLVE